MSLEKQKEFLFRDKKCSTERQKLPCLDINKLLDWSQIDSGLGCDGKRVLPKPRRFAAIFEKVLKPGKKHSLHVVINKSKIDVNNFTLDYFIRQTFALRIPVLHRFTSVTKWHVIVPFALMTDQRSQIDLVTPACSSACFKREKRS